MKKTILIIFLSCLLSSTSFSQNNNKILSIGFYNLENLFDTFDDPKTNDEEYTPEGGKDWDIYKYNSKIKNMAYAISQMTTSVYPYPPAILGVCEVENKKCLQDLVNDPQLKKYNYKIVHYDSPYKRGVDCALIYQEDLFKVLHSEARKLVLEDTSYYTRDQLVVTGLLDGDKVSIIVNHWPSRSGGELRSRSSRNLAGDLSRKIADELSQKDPNSKIIIMGDLNDDPINESVTTHLRAKGKISNLKKDDLFNTSFNTFDNGNGTLAYRGKWNLFDQIIISQPLLNASSGYKFSKYVIMNKEFLIRKSGKYKGYPFRTHAGGTYTNGYSDHFPVCIYLSKKQ